MDNFCVETDDDRERRGASVLQVGTIRLREYVTVKNGSGVWDLRTAAEVEGSGTVPMRRYVRF